MKGSFEYSVSMTNVIGEHDLEFRTCLKDVGECINPEKYLKASQV